MVVANVLSLSVWRRDAYAVAAVDPIVLVVEETFLIRNRGLVVAPALDPDRFRTPALLSVELVDPRGLVRQVHGRLDIEHFLLRDGGGKWQTVVVLDQDVGTVEVGTRLTARVLDR